MPPASSYPVEVRIAVARDSDLVVVQAQVRKMARAMGLSRQVEWEVATAASEVASNIVKYAGEGRIVLRWVTDDQPRLEFEAEDHGSGIGDQERALQDGVSEGRDLTTDEWTLQRRGLGTGLGAVSRLMDGMVTTSAPGVGTTVRAWKYL